MTELAAAVMEWMETKGEEEEEGEEEDEDEDEVEMVGAATAAR